jgi:hypothetical protein
MKKLLTVAIIIGVMGCEPKVNITPNEPPKVDSFAIMMAQREFITTQFLRCHNKFALYTDSIIMNMGNRSKRLYYIEKGRSWVDSETMYSKMLEATR